MEDQVPASNIPQQQPVEPTITAEQLQEMKRMALENAIRQQQAFRQQQEIEQQQFLSQEPKVVYKTRSLTIAELLLIIALSCGIVTGVQATWNYLSDLLPRIEIRAK